jgi:enoyl-CoA hydratase
MKTNISELDIIGRVGMLTINNGKKNFITEPEFAGQSILKEWIVQNRLCGLVICGNGKNFSYGADVKGVYDSQESVLLLNEKLKAGRALLDYIEALPIVTVAAIQGACFGAGLEIALSAKFRIVSEKAFLGLPEVSRGFIPGLGGCERIARLLGKSMAAKMCLLGEIHSAQDAKEYGYVDSIVEGDVKEKALSFVNELISEKSHKQIYYIMKNIINNKVTSGEGKDSAFTDVLLESKQKKGDLLT